MTKLELQRRSMMADREPLKRGNHLRGHLKKLNPVAIADDFRSISQKLAGVMMSKLMSVAEYVPIDERTYDIIEDTSNAGDFTDKEKKAIFEKMLNKMLVCILFAEDYKDGTFCKKTCPNWEHIQTAYVLEVFKNIGIHSASWQAHGSSRSIKDIIKGLIKSRRKDGRWGEDFYDTCLTLSSLLHYGRSYGGLVEGFHKAVGSSLKWVHGEIESNLERQKNNEWSGAGFVGAALRLFCEHFDKILLGPYGLTSEKLMKDINNLLLLAQNYRHNKNELSYYKSDPISVPNTPDIWHTAEMLIGLHYYNEFIKNATKLDVTKELTWLIDQQDEKGLWCHNMGSRFSFIITGRVIHTFALWNPNYCGQIIQKLYPVLKSHQNRNTGDAEGLIYDLPVTINLLLGISAKESIQKSSRINDIVAAIQQFNINVMIDLVAKVKDEVDALASKYQKARKGLLYLIILVVIIIAEHFGLISFLFKISYNFVKNVVNLFLT